MSIRIDNRGWCHDKIWGVLWIGKDVKECSYDIFWSAMLIGKNVKGRFHDKFDVQYELEQMIEDDVLN
jgi:hypothetical protein